MALDVNKIKKDLANLQQGIKDAEDQEYAKVKEQVTECIPLSKLGTNLTEFLNKIKLIPDDALYKIITELINKHENEEHLVIKCSLSTSKIHMLTSYKPCTFEYSYDLGLVLSIENTYNIVVDGESHGWETISVDTQEKAVLDHALFFNLCPIIEENGYTIMGSNDSSDGHDLTYIYDPDMFGPTIENRLTEFGLKILDSVCEQHNDSFYYLYYKVENPLFKN